MQSPPKFYIRCSAIGEIMTNPKGKSVAEQIDELRTEIIDRAEKIQLMKPGAKFEIAMRMYTRKTAELERLIEMEGQPNLSDTCKTHLKKWLIRELSGKCIEVKTRQMDKGNVVEEDAILYASCHIPGMGICVKNEIRFQDEWMQGTPDVIIQDEEVDDLKASYSADTFPLFETELPETGYDWQVKGYMALLESYGTPVKRGAVIYALMSMPEQMIQREARWQMPLGYTETEYQDFLLSEDYQKFAANYRYDDLEPALRLKKYVVEYDEEKVLAIRKRVEECRAYIETVLWPAFLANRQQFTNF